MDVCACVCLARFRCKQRIRTKDIINLAKQLLLLLLLDEKTIRTRSIRRRTLKQQPQQREQLQQMKANCISSEFFFLFDVIVVFNFLFFLELFCNCKNVKKTPTNCYNFKYVANDYIHSFPEVGYRHTEKLRL